MKTSDGASQQLSHPQRAASALQDDTYSSNEVAPRTVAQDVEVLGSSVVVIALKVAYNGAPFSGFARQPGQLTVQGSIEEALAMVFRRPIETTCAGRTDSGVHAKGQVVSFTLLESELEGRSEYKLLRSLNALTHEDISILGFKRENAQFSARFSAVMREYRYFICIDKAAPLFMKDFSWHLPKKLDISAMQQAAAYLEGEHDFKSFCLAQSAEGKPTSRFVKRISIEPLDWFGESLVVITVEGNAFLHSMVRTIVGTLVAVGTKQRSPEWVQEVLAAKNRSAAGENAPAKGLVFWHVSYEGTRIGPAQQNGQQLINQQGGEQTGKGQDGRQNNQQANQTHNQQANQEENTSVNAQRKKEKHSHKTAGKKRKPARGDFVIPRGDGINVTSGACFSDIKENSAEQDVSAVDVNHVAITDQNLKPVESLKLDDMFAQGITHNVASVYATQTGVYGELEDMPSDIEEGCDSENTSYAYKPRYPFQKKIPPQEQANVPKL